MDHLTAGLEPPAPLDPQLPEPLRVDQPPRTWLVDVLAPEDLEDVKGLLDAMGRTQRAAPQQEARERFGPVAPSEVNRAVAELVIRYFFGPDRLARYL